MLGVLVGFVGLFGDGVGYVFLMGCFCWSFLSEGVVDFFFWKGWVCGDCGGCWWLGLMLGGRRGLGWMVVNFGVEGVI